MKRPDIKYWTVAIIAILSTMAVWAAAGMKTIYQNYDGPYYVVIAKTWYDQNLIRNSFSFPLPVEYYPAHFPLFPIVISLMGQIGSIGLIKAMVLANLVASAIGVGVIFKIAQRLKWGDPFWIALAWLFWWPRMWAIRSVGSPETLFIGLLVGSMYFFQTKKYWWAAILGSLAVLTKSPGILLLITYCLILIVDWIKTNKIEWKAWPITMIGLTLIGLFGFYYLKTGDFWAYFHTGDNIHLGLLPFRIFDSSQAWVGSFWLEDVIWIYIISGIGIYRALKKNLLWGIYGLVFFVPILFVSHRDIARYSLPIVPVILYGLAEIFDRKEVRWALVLLIIPLFFYTLNFVTQNTLAIADWTPLL